jgi:uncharacterized surface protein with fasciclin (FAS1) repeats
MSPNRRTVLRGIGAGTALALGGVGTAVARGPPEGVPRDGASAEQNLVETALALNESGPYAGLFDELVAAVTSADLVGALSDPDVQYTVFAPVDPAFEAVYDADNGIDEAGDVPASILLYHLTNGRRYAKSVVNAPRLRMLTGQTVTVDENDQLNGDANIVATDVEASNGVVHAIDSVLLPP